MMKMYESPQETKPNYTTQREGGDRPGMDSVIKSANARGGKRHDTSGDTVADVNVLPSSGGESLDKAGIMDDGYIVKKNLPFGVNTNYNSLPPGMNIADQEIADIRKQEMSTWKGGLSYPGDGWD